MGSYTFTWEHAADEVFVTGDFDNWAKKEQLTKENGIFKKTLELPKSKHTYKFVVDGNWVTNDSAPKEADASGIYNNVLTADDIKESVSTLSSAAPESSTAALAGAVSKNPKSKSEESIPGAFPLTPPAETPSMEPKAFSINPIPASEGLGNPVKLEPGEKVPEPSTLTSNTIDSTVKHDKEPAEDWEEKVSVAPIPATAGLGNPIHLAPGEKVPDSSTLTSNTVSSTATTDPASYEKSASALAPQLGPVVTPQAERDARGGMFGLPSIVGGLIPESSLPRDVNTKTEQDPGFTVQSAAPTSTTAALAGQVPKEPRGVPETVTESQKEAGFAPEASANPEAVIEKKELEQELKAKVPEEPAAAESSVTGQVGTAAATGATAVAGTVAAATYAAKEKAGTWLNYRPNATETVGSNGQAVTGEVPEVVSESQKEAHASPEASANPEAVHEKKAVESELLKEIPKSTGTGESAPVISSTTTSGKGPADAVPDVVAQSQKEAHASPEASANAEAVHEKKAVESELLKEIPRTTESGGFAPNVTSATTTGQAPADAVPDVVAQSQKEAHASPEASANAEAVHEKKAVESELLKEIPRTTESGGFAPNVTSATTTGQAPAEVVPEVVAESQKEAHASPEASANPEAVHEKKEVESELLQEVKKATESGEPAPTVTAATSAAAPGLSDEALTDAEPLKSSSEPNALNAPASAPAIPETSRPLNDSRDVSPMSKQPTANHNEPTVTTGTTTSAIPETSKKETAAPSSAKAAPESVDSSAADKKKKRRSIFGKLKEKFSSK